MVDSLTILEAVLGPLLKRNVPLGQFTTYKIGGPAEFFAEIKETGLLVRTLREAFRNGIKVTVIGGGTNLLVSDRGVGGLVIRNTTRKIQLKGVKASSAGGKPVRHVFVESEAGVPVNQLVRYTVDQGLQGLENHLGLPGTVGGAIYMNSKWTKPLSYIGDALFQAEILTPEGEIRSVPREYFRFRYDYSRLQETGDVLLNAVFRLEENNREKLWEHANSVVAYRRQTQPQGLFTAGCVFQNLTVAEAVVAGTPNQTVSAGQLLDMAGLKGFFIGDAVISSDHANFFINRRQATAGEMLSLIEHAKKTVREKFGVDLKEEIRIIGRQD